MLDGDSQQVGHIARLAVLGMCARGVAASAFSDSPDVLTVVITVSRPEPFFTGELPTVIEYGGRGDVSLYGSSL